jgi:hypothetical protein
MLDGDGGGVRPVGPYNDALEHETLLDPISSAAILTAMPRSWTISVAILVVCLLASIVIAITKLS